MHGASSGIRLFLEGWTSMGAPAMFSTIFDLPGSNKYVYFIDTALQRKQ